jgi:hypothetical protein
MNPQHLVIIWAALAISQLVYLCLPAPPLERTAPASDLFPLALGVVAIVQAAIIVAILRVRAFEPVQSGRLDPSSKAGAAKLFIALMVAWILAESVAINGFVLRFLHFPRAITLPFSIAGVFLLYVGRPWSAKLKRPASTADLARSNTPLS